VSLPGTRRAASAAITAYVEVASTCVLTVRSSKTKFMVVGIGVEEEDKLPLIVQEEHVSWVSAFHVISDNGRCNVEVDKSWHI